VGRPYLYVKASLSKRKETQSSIWGLSKQGKVCKTCGLSVHAKCELKVISSCRDLNYGVNKATNFGAARFRQTVHDQKTPIHPRCLERGPMLQEVAHQVNMSLLSFFFCRLTRKDRERYPNSTLGLFLRPIDIIRSPIV
jgi:hypothetical protein